MDLGTIQQLATAVALSSLIGLEREHTYQMGSYTNFGGIRTFALIGLIGVVGYRLMDISPFLFVALSAGLFALIVAAYVMTTISPKSSGATSEVAAFNAYLIGVLCGMGQFLLATAVAVTVLMVLHFKDPLHKWAKKINNAELISTIQFILITFVVLPLLPNQDYGPYGFFNPFHVWLMVVFVSGIFFASYIAIKAFGQKKGIAVTGLLAGFISTTALAFGFAEESKKNVKVISPFVIGIVIASSATFFRVLIEVFILNRELANYIIMPMVVMGFVGGVISIWVYKRMDKNAVVHSNLSKVKSPFRLTPALKFGLLFAGILFIMKAASAEIGSEAVYLLSLVLGGMDIDSITVTLANIANVDITYTVAATALTMALIANVIAKVLIFAFFGSRKVALKLLYVFAPVVASGVITLMFIG